MNWAARTCRSWPSFPDRGVGSDALGRTASLLVELAVDVQPHGWRFVDRPGKDLQRAKSALSTDINILADVIGAEEAPSDDIKIQLRGPLSLAAGLHLHNGERALIDYGARRDIAASLAAGVEGYLKRVAAAAPGARIVVQIDEPEIAVGAGRHHSHRQRLPDPALGAGPGSHRVLATGHRRAAGRRRRRDRCGRLRKSRRRSSGSWRQARTESPCRFGP